MNKAFVREPDEPDHLKCPRCSAIGVPVSAATLAANLPTDAVALLGVSGCFCPSPACSVAYFDAHGSTVPADRLTRPVYPKHAAGPICPCLAVAADEVEADAQRGDATRVRRILAHAQSPDARCSHLTPTGRPCTGDVQKLYLRHHRR